jgi:hypothetical protein
MKAENPSNAGDRHVKKEVMSGGSERRKTCYIFGSRTQSGLG